MASQVRSKSKCFKIYYVWFCCELQPHQMEVSQQNNMDRVWDNCKSHPNSFTSSWCSSIQFYTVCPVQCMGYFTKNIRDCSDRRWSVFVWSWGGQVRRTKVVLRRLGVGGRGGGSRRTHRILRRVFYCACVCSVMCKKYRCSLLKKLLVNNSA